MSKTNESLLLTRQGEELAEGQLRRREAAVGRNPTMKGNEEAGAGGSTRRAEAGDSGRNPRKAAPGASCDPSEKENPVAQNQQLIEELIERDNLNRAWKQVRRNRGSPGADGRDMDQTRSYLKEYWVEIETHLLAGTYRPKPVKRVEIPKPGGGTRRLGVPTILDRFIQQAAMQVTHADLRTAL